LSEFVSSKLVISSIHHVSRLRSCATLFAHPGRTRRHGGRDSGRRALGNRSLGEGTCQFWPLWLAALVSPLATAPQAAQNLAVMCRFEIQDHQGTHDETRRESTLGTYIKPVASAADEFSSECQSCCRHLLSTPISSLQLKVSSIVHFVLLHKRSPRVISPSTLSLGACISLMLVSHVVYICVSYNLTVIVSLRVTFSSRPGSSTTASCPELDLPLPHLLPHRRCKLAPLAAIHIHGGADHFDSQFTMQDMIRKPRCLGPVSGNMAQSSLTAPTASTVAPHPEILLKTGAHLLGNYPTQCPCEEHVTFT
jgi:hypothetical protein